MKEELAKIHRAVGGGKLSGGVDLEEGEIVEMVIRRSRAGIILIWAGEVFGFALLTILLVVMSRNGEGMLLQLNGEAKGYLNLLIFMMYIVLIASGWIGTVVYRANALTVTNRRAIQRTTTSLFARSLNVIELSSIEDVSFAEKNILDRIFGMGTVRMSTVGDETTYSLSYVAAREVNVKKIARIVHAAKDRRKGKVDK